MNAGGRSANLIRLFGVHFRLLFKKMKEEGETVVVDEFRKQEKWRSAKKSKRRKEQRAVANDSNG